MKNQKTKGGSGAETAGKPERVVPKRAAKAAALATLAAKRDPRSVPAPTAPAAVAEKAAAAIAAVPAVAEAAPKSKTGKAAAPKLVARAAPAVAKAAPAAVKPAPAPAPKLESALPNGGIVASAEKAIAPLATALEAGADQARAAYARAQDTGDGIRQAVAQSASATTRGLAEINGKVLDLIRAQNDATIDLWRSTLTAPSLSDAVRAQTSGLRLAYEATAAQWKEIAETAGRLMGDAAKPLRSVFTQAR